MAYPDFAETKAEWWRIVDENWPNLKSIIKRFAPRAEIQLDLDKIPGLKEARAPDLVNYFEAAWEGAPDQLGLHEIPAWGILCDLCSESYVLQEAP